MLYVEAKQPTHRTTIGYMDAYAKEDSTGRRIKWARKRLGWKQDALCDRVGIGIVYLSALENDKRSASRETMTRLAEVLGVSRAFLEMETPDPAPMTTDPAAPTPPMFRARWTTTAIVNRCSAYRRPSKRNSQPRRCSRRKRTPQRSGGAVPTCWQKLPPLALPCSRLTTPPPRTHGCAAMCACSCEGMKWLRSDSISGNFSTSLIN